MFVGIAVYAAVLFGTAGTVRWPAAWLFLVISTSVLVAYLVIVVRLHPDLIRERRKPPRDAKRWDRPFVALIGGVGPVALVLLCGLDHRFGWTAPMPVWLTAVGLLFVAAGGVVTNLAVAVNHFFSALVRIQHDRGHRVVDVGPYAVVRHPAYAASIVHMFGAGFALGSAYGVGVATVLTLAVIVRTGLEDRTLRAELDGYAEYSARVRYRLAPGIW
jgi:protein-S-isoprenylcysteine O-methyltransferase Ste14